MLNGAATVGQLRDALEGIPDHTPLIVNAVHPDDPELFTAEQVITSAGFGAVDWGDGYGLEPDSAFAINCRATTPEEEIRFKPTRPHRPKVQLSHPEAEAEL
jgi:hypothetical protein